MQLRDAVDAMRADHREVCHAHAPVAFLVDQRHATAALEVMRIARAHDLQEIAVDLVDDLQVPRQEPLEERDRPGLQRLGQQRVIGVAARVANDLPRDRPLHVVDVDQQAHQLDDGHRRMRVVELDRDRLREILQLPALREMLREHVLQRRADAEILLLEAQLLALRRRIVRVQHAREVLRLDLLGDGRVIVARVERFDLERRDAAPRPQPQMIHRRAAIARDEQVIRDSPHVLRLDPLVAHAALLVARRLAAAAEAHAIAHAAVAAVPKVVHAEPGARDFALRAVLADDLREDAVVVADAVAGRRITERRERIEKARGEPAETAVAEPGIFFLGGDAIEILAERLDRLAHLFQQAVLERGQRVDETAAEQELHREITDALHARAFHASAGCDPALGELFADCDRQRVVDVAARGAGERLAERALQSIDDRVADRAGTQRRRGMHGGGLRLHDVDAKSGESPITYIVTFSSTMRHEPLSRTMHELLLQRVDAEALRERNDAAIRTVRLDLQSLHHRVGHRARRHLLAPLLEPRAGARGVRRRDELRRVQSDHCIDFTVRPGLGPARDDFFGRARHRAGRAEIRRRRVQAGVAPRLAGGGLFGPESPAPPCGSAASCRPGPAAAHCYARPDTARPGRHSPDRSRRKRPAGAATPGQ